MIPENCPAPDRGRALLPLRAKYLSCPVAALFAVAALILVNPASAEVPAAAAAPEATVEDVTDHSITLGSLNCGTQYRLSVRESSGDNRQVLYLTTQDCGAPPPYTVSVDPLNCGTQYRISVREESGGNPQVIYVTTDNCDEPPPPPPPPGGGDEPAPIAGQGYSKVWSDEFTSFDLGTWEEGIWYEPGSPPGSIYANNGVLHLVSRRSQGYPNVTVTTEAGTTPRVFTFGYFESRMRWTKGPGAWPAFWLLSYRHSVNSAWPSINPFCVLNSLAPALCYAAELDVFEGQGTQPTVFYGTVHRNSSGDYGVTDTQNENNYQETGIDLTADFHTYGMLWTATTISWYLDGRYLHSAPVYDSTNQPQFLLLDMFIGGWTTGTDATTPDELHLETDWVRVWQK
jgi:hypothetical protein